ncbi:MAG: DUF3344 domain-containing protein [Candidatus Brocadiaceae bacterium]|nr:DUF3344 domain-containing protein [Candidatus Brocadiaceae bacterium]
MNMKLIWPLFLFIIFSMVALQVDSIFADQGVAGSDVSSEADIRVEHTFRHINASHVANGVALRNRASGWIHLRGVPSGSTVLQAYLYFNFSDTKSNGSDFYPVLFNGNRLTAGKVADNADPCWGMGGNHTYRVTVTPFIPTSNPNQDYEVVPIFGGRVDTTGENPWAGTFPAPNKRFEGATLVVVYTNEEIIGNTVFIYDALSGSEFSSILTATLLHPFISGTGLFTMSGADGQRGGGHDNAFSNETGTFNGVQFSGPPVAASDWDGSDGLPLPQLWDVHTHIVKMDGQASTIIYNAGSDCLVPVVFILDI